MQKQTKILLSILLFLSNLVNAQSKIGIQVGVGSVVAYSELIPVKNHTPNFHTLTKYDEAYYIGLKYYFNPKFYTAFGLARNERWMSVGYYIPAIDSYQNTSGIGMLNTLYTFVAGYNLLGNENKRWTLDAFGGFQLEKQKDRFSPLGGNSGLIRLEKTSYVGWHPLINGGLGMDFHFKKSKIGIDFSGSLGFKSRVDIFYRASDFEGVYEVVNRFKGTHLALLLSYERTWNFKKKVENNNELEVIQRQ